MDLGQQLISVAIGIVVGSFLIPYSIHKIQRCREKKLVKTLLRRWGNDCMLALFRLKPVTSQTMSIEEVYIEGFENKPKSWQRDIELQTLKQFWLNIRDGKTEPNNSYSSVHEALHKVLFTKKEREQEGQKAPSEKTYPFQVGGQNVAKALIKSILNAIYARLEIFELELLPIDELEIAMSYLDNLTQLGNIKRSELATYALHLSQSMEKFGTYLWKLERWSQKSKRTWLSLR